MSAAQDWSQAVLSPRGPLLGSGPLTAEHLSSIISLFEYMCGWTAAENTLNIRIITRRARDPTSPTWESNWGSQAWLRVSHRRAL